MVSCEPDHPCPTMMILHAITPLPLHTQTQCWYPSTHTHTHNYSSMPLLTPKDATCSAFIKNHINSANLLVCTPPPSSNVLHYSDATLMFTLDNRTEVKCSKHFCYEVQGHGIVVQGGTFIAVYTRRTNNEYLDRSVRAALWFGGGNRMIWLFKTWRRALIWRQGLRGTFKPSNRSHVGFAGIRARNHTKPYQDFPTCVRNLLQILTSPKVARNDIITWDIFRTSLTSRLSDCKMAAGKTTSPGPSI